MEKQNYLGILMFLLSVAILCARGFFLKRKKIKTAIVLIIFIGLILSKLQYGKELFIDFTFDTIAYLIFITLIIIFIMANNHSDENKVLNLFDYNFL